MKRIFAIFLIIAAAVCMQAAARPSGDTVSVSSGGRVIRVIDLSSAEDCEFDVEYEGRKNTVRIEGGAVSVSCADCPDGTCVRTGILRRGRPVICLPNRLVIDYSDGAADCDAVLGGGGGA